MTLAQFLVIFFGPVAVLAVIGLFAYLAGRKRIKQL
jgi:hypothetical protein